MAEEGRSRISDVLPGDPNFLEGEYDIDGPFKLTQGASSIMGDVYNAQMSLYSPLGTADYSFLGTDKYFIEWGGYDLQGEMSMSADVRKSYVNLHFQLDGSLHADQPIEHMPIPIRGGDTNLSFVPPFADTFNLHGTNRGDSFSILLSRKYFEQLSHRYPHLLGDQYDRMLRGQGFVLRNQHLTITPEMWGVISRIKRRGLDHEAGSLYLESQILELLALQLEQVDRPAKQEPSLCRDATERLHAARDFLLQRLSNPPTLAEVARHAGINEYALKQGFRQLFGTSPYAYLLKHRLELARSYVLDTDWTIAEIAYEVGYSDPAHLTNAFRKEYGVPPSTLR